MAAIVRPFLVTGRPLPFGQINLEMHVWNKNFAEFLSWWEMLETAGLRPFMTEVRLRLYFLGCCELISRPRLQPNLVYQNYNKQSNTELAEVRLHVPDACLGPSSSLSIQYSFLNVKGYNVFIADSPPPDVTIDGEVEPNPMHIRHGPRPTD